VLTLFIGVRPALMPVAYSSPRGVRVPPVMTNFIPCTKGVPSVHAPAGSHGELIEGARSPYGCPTAAEFADIGNVTCPRTACTISLRKIDSRTRTSSTALCACSWRMFAQAASVPSLKSQTSRSSRRANASVHSR
jgi:hypothetical protein